MKIFFRFLIFIFIFSSTQHIIKGQFTIGGQLRTRSELRQGQGTLPEPSKSPAFFTSQRTRLNVGYATYRLNFYISIQDVRVWGQDISSINRTTADANNGIMAHEAWADISLRDTNSTYNLSLKIGRQELIYNDARLLGNLDWLQQARRHDLALLKFSSHKITGHMGFAFNQNKEGKSETIYNGSPTFSSGYPSNYPAGTNNIGTMYKSLQFAFINRQLNSGKISFLLLKDDFNKYKISGSSRTSRRGVWSRITGGSYAEILFFKKLKINNSLYYQAGKDKDGNELSAYLLSLHSSYSFNKRFSLGAGADLTSGNDETKSFATNKAFDPLYGTAHKFWGYMDFFYAGDAFGNGGLIDYYFKSNYALSKKTIFLLDIHEFYSKGKIENTSTPETDAMDSRLGTEIDLICSYSLTNKINLEGGYSIMLGTNTLDKIKQPFIDKKNIGHWAYLMISVKPDFLK